MTPRPGACDRCLARPWWLSRLTGHLDCARSRIQPLLGLDDENLVAAVAGAEGPRAADEFASFDPAAARAHALSAGLELVCRCDGRYPTMLRALAGAAPAVLHVAGGMDCFLDLCRNDPVAVVGARRASSYGLEVAHALGRGLSASGVTVISGMATGIDAAAHAGALSAGGRAVAVLPGSADRAYPVSKRALHRAILADGAAVSELAPGAEIRRWTFPARNRLIAALSAITVVVEAGERSGSLITAELAGDLGRPVGAVPGRVSCSQAAGPNQLLAEGAHLIRGAKDVLDLLVAAGIREVDADLRGPRSTDSRAPELTDFRAPLSAEQHGLLQAIAEGDDTSAALARAGVSPERGLAAIASLELGGYLRRVSGGRYAVILPSLSPRGP
ncbi:MAG: DNA-processing protein DprA [Solirubrobacteraceae bacterium]